MPLRSDLLVPLPNALPPLLGLPVHVLGIRGRGMLPVALGAVGAGADVDGCDRSRSAASGRRDDGRLEAAGIAVAGEHDRSHVGDRHLVVTSMIHPDHPEVAPAAEAGRLHHRVDLLAAVVGGRRTVAVTGTHGKGTVAALVGCGLARSGADPLVMLGVPVGVLGGSFRPGTGPAVVEADDADGSIARVPADVSVVTNSWSDHPMFGRTRTEVVADVARHVAAVDPTGRVVVGRDRSLDGVARAARAPVWRLGRDLEVETIEVTDEGRVVRLHDPVEGAPVVARVAIHGGGVVDNVALAFGALRATGLGPDEAADSLAALDRLDRRLEPVGTAAGVRVFDDLGKHPEALRANLAALRDLGPRRLHVIFEPSLHADVLRWSRRWAAVLDQADHAIVLPVRYTASLPVARRARADWPRRAGSSADLVADRAGAIELTRGRVEPGDVVLVCGVADDLGDMAGELLAGLGG